MVNPQVSLLNLTLEADIPGDIMRSIIDGKHILSVPHHDGLFVDRVDLNIHHVVPQRHKIARSELNELDHVV